MLHKILLQKSGCILFLLFIISCHYQKPECSFIEDPVSINYQCGKLRVLLDYSDKNADSISLAYVVIPARRAPIKPDPIVFLQGGPGGSVIPNIKSYENFQIDPQRPLILFDPRGTGYSDPVCPSLTSKLFEVFARDIKLGEEFEYIKPFISECLDAGFQPKNFTIQQNIQDLESLRTHLGIQKWNILGGSYGSRWALEYAEQFPSNISSCLLMGVFPPEIRMYNDLLTNFSNAIQDLFDRCQNDPECQEKYPDLTEIFSKATAKLEKNPVQIQVFNKPFVLNAQDFMFFIHQMLYNPGSVGYIPRFIKAILEDDPTIISNVVESIKNVIDMLHLDVAYSILAFDEHQYLPQSQMDLDQLEKPYIKSGIAFFQSDPKVLNMMRTEMMSPGLMEKNDTITIPLLLVNGQYDPITPSSNIDKVIGRLPNAQSAVFADQGHAPLSPCFFQIAYDFLNNPTEHNQNECNKTPISIKWF
jgi:pimeloyl-ACP methyl ester carboxylesterase